MPNFPKKTVATPTHVPPQLYDKAGSMLLKIVTLLRKVEVRQLFSLFLSSMLPTAASCMLLKFGTCSMPPTQKNDLKQIITKYWPN